jgi:hypothetical protein
MRLGGHADPPGGARSSLGLGDAEAGWYAAALVQQQPGEHVDPRGADALRDHAGYGVFNNLVVFTSTIRFAADSPLEGDGFEPSAEKAERLKALGASDVINEVVAITRAPKTLAATATR